MKRMERASRLTEQCPWALELLGFYGHVLEFQKSVYEKFDPPSTLRSPTSGSLREEIDLTDASRHLPSALHQMRRHGTAKLREQAEALTSTSRERFREALELVAFNGDAADEPIHFLARVVLQPYGERLAQAREFAVEDSATAKCPNCGGEPQLAIIRPEGDGGKRSLLCWFCQTEWEFRRILCPQCGERHHEKLPRYSEGNASAARVEACDTCRTYLKSFDLTVDGLAVPMVDEIATAPLDLWAADHGYTKLHPNILGF
jgi:FdhE protein